MQIKKILSMLLIISLFAGCASLIYVPTEKIARKNHIPLERLKYGRKLFVKKCSTCHSLVNPSKFNEMEWRDMLKVMSKRAKLNKKEHGLILDYLRAGSKNNNFN